MILRIEKKYKKELPVSYVNLLKQQNGGSLIKKYFVKQYVDAFEVSDYVFEIVSILGISSDESNTASLEYKTDVLREEIKEWELTAINPEDIIVFGNDVSAGHANYLFDYSESFKGDEPKIVYYDNELDHKFGLADNFEQFISNLKIKEELELESI